MTGGNPENKGGGRRAYFDLVSCSSESVYSAHLEHAEALPPAPQRGLELLHQRGGGSRLGLRCSRRAVKSALCAVHECTEERVVGQPRLNRVWACTQSSNYGYMCRTAGIDILINRK